MKTKVFLLAVVVLLLVTNAMSLYRVYIYEHYYCAVEEFLDTLEDDCNWVDRFDPYDYYEWAHTAGKHHIFKEMH